MRRVSKIPCVSYDDDFGTAARRDLAREALHAFMFLDDILRIRLKTRKSEVRPNIGFLGVAVLSSEDSSGPIEQPSISRRRVHKPTDGRLNPRSRCGLRRSREEAHW